MDRKLCRYFLKGKCKYGEECYNLHELNKEELEASKDKQCGICLDVVINKTDDNRFGLLLNCNHVFCIQCIRKWRKDEPEDAEIPKACPECRTPSAYIVASTYWPTSSSMKEEIISKYVNTLKTKVCKYFKCGPSRCPYQSDCLYNHPVPEPDWD